MEMLAEERWSFTAFQHGDSWIFTYIADTVGLYDVGIKLTEVEVANIRAGATQATLKGFVCEGYEFKGEPVASATVTYLKFQGIWHRLCFEFRGIFWRRASEEPAPWEVAEESWVYPHANVGEIAGIAGRTLLEYEMIPTLGGSKVIFKFANGKSVVIEDKSDTASYAIVNLPVD